jgi:hypothetical protein
VIRKIPIFFGMAMLAAGCSTAPVHVDSGPSQKQLSFPQVGVQSVVQVGAVAALFVDYQSNRIYQLAKPLSLTVMMVNSISVSTGEPLFKSELDGATVYCTSSKVYVDRLTGPWAVACFKSTSPGKFSSVTYRPGAVWLSKTIEPEVDFVAWESAVQGQGKPIKRELVFDGRHGDVLMFSERIYKRSIDTASVIKPIFVPVPSLPAKASLDGMEINVLRADEHALTFEVTTPWQ